MRHATDLAYVTVRVATSRSRPRVAHGMAVPGRRFAGFRLVATDATWCVGDGPAEIRMLLTGRDAELDRLSGDLERVR